MGGWLRGRRRPGMPPPYAVWLLLLVAAPLAAEQSWYQAEVIIFARDGEYRNAEQWPAAPTLPDSTNARLLQPLDHPDPTLRQIPPEQQQLTEVWQRLRRSRGFKPLLHLAWQQPGLAREAAVSVALPATAADGSAIPLLGQITLSLSRYHHLDADIAYQLPWADPEWYRLQGALRMRSGELHYLDHPLFGLLAKVVPIAPPSP